jgi:phthiodiolone/phenolphthiodiolone dimycocerosates ketoreductase
MLGITARFADGWLPADLTLEGYRDRWDDLSGNLQDRGRDPDAFTAALFSNLIIGESKAECLEMMDSPMVKARALGLPPERYEAVGATHPLGDEGGITHYTPSKLSREEAMAAVESVPVEAIEPSTFYGTAGDVIDQIVAYEAAGLDHMIFWNETPFGDPEKVEDSYRALNEVVEYFADRD